MTNLCRGVHTSAWMILIAIFVPASALAEPVPLKRVVELALSHATAASIASADEERTKAMYRDLKGNYIPQLFTGAGLGYSYGFPLGLEGSAPSLFNVNTQSMLLNPSMKDFLRAAKADNTAAALTTKEQRNQVIQDAVLSYAELEKWEQRLTQLRETQSEAEKMQASVSARVKEGIDSELDGMKAELSAARVRQRVAEAEGSAVVVREHLSRLTGLPSSSIETEPESMPEFPAPEKENPAVAPETNANPGVQAAIQHARAQYLRAEGEHRAWWPSLDFAAQYALLSKFNNYENYYIPSKPCTVASVTVLCVTNSFHQNNATIGVAIRFPFFNASQKARAQEADADALKASKQAEAVRNQASEEALRLQRAVAQLQAARDVAHLEYEIAQKTLGAVQTRMDQGTATLHDLDDARTQVSERFIALQDVTFDLERSQLGLLRSTGDLEKWALGK